MTAQSRKASRTSAVDTVTADKPTAQPTPADYVQAAPVAEKAAKRTVKSAPLDLSALTVAEAPKPVAKPSTGAGRKKVDNSVAEGWLRESWAARAEGEKMGGGKAVTVPTAALGTLKSRLNMAAATLDLGCAIQAYTDGDKLPDGTTVTLADGQTRVVFAAKVRKVKAAKPTA